MIKNRWVILGAALVNMFCLGAIYMWSVFSKSLVALHQWNPSEVSFAYSLLLIVLFVVGIFVGSLQNRFDPRVLLFVGIVFWSAGWYLTGTATSIGQLYLYYGVFGGIGDGFVLHTITASLMRWFPDRKGFASGLGLAFCALAPLPLAPLAYVLVENYGVMASFKMMGAIFFVVMMATFWIIGKPEANWRPKGWEDAGEERSIEKGLSPGEMLRQPIFYLQFLLYALAASSGAMVISHASGIGEEIGRLTGGEGAILVGVFAVVNFLGRAGMGSISDRMGRYRPLLISLILMIGALVFFDQMSSFFGFMIFSFVIILGYGAMAGIFPSIVADTFGEKYIGANWPLMYGGYSLASFIGPYVGAKSLEVYGSYGMAFKVEGAISAVALLILLLVMKMSKRYDNQ